MEDQTLKVVGEIGQPDLRLGPLQADGADEQAHAVLLVSEDMLDGCADRRLSGIGPGGPPGPMPENQRSAHPSSMSSLTRRTAWACSSAPSA